MLVEMALTGKVKDVKPEVADVLFRVEAARPVYQTRELKPDPVRVIASEVSAAINAAEDVALTGAEEISPRTGKPKRRYKRRDLRAED